MNIQEYEKVKKYTYLEYCDYLQRKYGIGLANYMSENWKKAIRLQEQKKDFMFITSMKTMPLC